MTETMTAQPVAEAPRATGFPLVGNTFDMLYDPARFLTETYHKLGSVFHVQAGFKKYVVLAGEDANKLLAREDGVLLESHTLFGDFAEFIGAEYMLTAIDGEPHKHMRRMMRQGFSRSAAMPHVNTMIDIVREYVDSWDDGASIPVLEMMRRIVVDQLGIITTNYRPTDYFDDILHYNNTMLNTEVLKTYPDFVRQFPRFRRALQRLEGLSEELLAWHRDNPPGDNRHRDLIDDVMDSTAPDGQPFSKGDLFNMTVGPYVAGMDTLASTLAFFVYTMAKYPDVMAACKAETAALFAGETVDLSDFRKMETLHAAALETLRLYPATPFTPRVVGKAFDFDGYYFPVGTELMFAQTLTHFLPEHYENPYTFDVTRFMGDNKGRMANIYTPFTVGAHTCLGAGLAEVQMLITMAALLHYTDFDLTAPDYDVKIHTLPLPNPGNDFQVVIHKSK
ncbi:MAG: cytochrome P450 [Anaerolineae bacterium]